MEMQGIQSVIKLKLTTLVGWHLVMSIGFLLITSLVAGAQNSVVQDPIINLHNGYLIVRFPAYKAKIDTLDAMISRSTESNKQRLIRLRNEAVSTRDSMLKNYTAAFKSVYTFSKTAYFFDYDAHNLNTATYYNMDGEKISVGDLSEYPLFYLYFERTEESRIDAMVIYDRNNKKVPAPFPNTFAQGGFNLILVKIADKKFPEWRVKKMNKKLWKYYNDVRMDNFEEEGK